MGELLKPLNDGKSSGKSSEKGKDREDHGDVPQDPGRDNPAFNNLIKKIRKCNEEISIINTNSENIKELDEKYKKAANPEKEKCTIDHKKSRS